MNRKKQPEPKAPPPWTLTQADLDATTDLDVAFATTRCLPPEDIIPHDFWPDKVGYAHNGYLRLVDALFVGNEVPNMEFTFNEGFTGNKLMEFTVAHLKSFDPSHEHKIAGIAFMLSKIITIKE